MALLTGFSFHRILAVPRPPDDPSVPDDVHAHLFAALSGIHAELSRCEAPDAAVAVAWQRTADKDGLRVLVGGRPLFPPAMEHAAGVPGRVLYPPGSVGVPLESDAVLAQFAALPMWLACPGQVDPLWTSAVVDLGRRNQFRQRGGFDDYVAHLADPFVWLIVATPLPMQTVDRELLTLATTIPRLRQRENSELDRVALDRAQARYRELSRHKAGGVWHVRVLVGSVDEVGARRAAALLCGASDLDDLPYVLYPGEQALSFDQLGKDVTGEQDAPRSPFIASTDLVAAIGRPPRRELPGIRLVEMVPFDVTPERDGPIRLGEVLDDGDRPAGDFGVDMSTLNRHTFVAGATGGGKSQTVRHLLEQLHHAGVPWLVIEPAKSEYAAMAGRIGADQVTVIRPGDPSASAVGLNPLEPEPGFPIQTHIDLVRALFLAAFEAAEPFPQVISHALSRCYTELGWDTVLSESRLPGVTPRYPTLADLQRTAFDVVAGIGYGKEITDNVRGFIDVRLSSLRLGTPGRFFEGGHPLDITDLLRRNVTLEIEDVGNDQDKAFFIGAVLIRLHQHMRLRHTRGAGGAGLRHVTVIEEAHRLLKRVEPGSSAAHAVELFTSLLAEIRAYGEGIVVAEQIPTKVVPDIIKNTALKIIHRLPAADDRDVLGATANLNEAQSRHIVSLPPGNAVVFADGMDRPMRVQIPYGENREGVGAGAPAAIREPRSVACGTECRARACVLREINLAARLADDPRLILWIELLTVAHLVGKPAPRPDRTWLNELSARTDRRTLECALAHRVSAAVDCRYSGLTAHYQPERLAEHLVTSAMATIDGPAQPSCGGEERRWQAGRYRWIDVFHALRTATAPDDGPHPDTDAWAVRGLSLAGATVTEQLASLRACPDTWLPSRDLITGGEQPVYEGAVARLSNAAEPDKAFLEATKFLGLGTTWPVYALNLVATDR
jgi:DNA helicase HerA-like ATPase